VPDRTDSGGASASAPTVLRILLGTQLRRLRESRDVTAREAASAIRGSESKISRIELGRTTVREIDILDLLDLYGVHDRAEREQLLTLASQANQPGWWHRYADVLPDWFQSYIGLEESAQSIRSFDAQFVPGLLQTDDYALAVFQLGGYLHEETDRLALLRKERQRRFASGRFQLSAIVDEVALRRQLGGRALMRAQLARLLDLSLRPGLSLQVSPLLTGASYAAPGSFSILTFPIAELPDVVYLEQLTSAMYLDKPADVARYSEAMDQIEASCYSPESSRELMRSVLVDSEES
jgi:transcriptional regulator with XRE-family HTH domain